jgi:choline-glycine betaine transporter
MCFGVLVLALPVTVIGSNFSAAFHKALAEEKAYFKKQRMEERKQNASAKNSETSSPSFSRLTSLN